MLPNECFALACRAYYDEIGLVVDEKNGEFAHCPLPERYGDKGYYLLHDHHQQQGLLQSRDIGECCFFSGDTKKWLLTCEIFPDNYFELWDIYEEFASLHFRKNLEKIHAEKEEGGKSKHAVKTGKKGLAALIEKDPEHQSKAAVKGGYASMAKKDENGKSKHATEMSRLASMKRQRMVELIRISDREVFIFESLKFAGEILNLNRHHISNVCRGHEKTVGGYTARYLD